MTLCHPEKPVTTENGKDSWFAGPELAGLHLAAAFRISLAPPSFA